MRLGKNSKVDLIRHVPLFAACSKNELAEIAVDRGRDRPA